MIMISSGTSRPFNIDSIVSFNNVERLREHTMSEPGGSSWVASDFGEAEGETLGKLMTILSFFNGSYRDHYWKLLAMFGEFARR
jgi:hypothetical protein